MAEGVMCAAFTTGRRVFIAVLCLLALTAAAGARSKPVSRNIPVSAAADAQAAIPDSQFVIGDFDGDRQPDLATVELSRFNALRSRYSISFRLSKGKPQTIGITGPAGGLTMVARDVNGDRALDLILVTAWRHELVAILLNDGQGNFSAAAPGQFQFDGVSPKSLISMVRQLGEDRTALSFSSSPIKDPSRGIFEAQQSPSRYGRTRLAAVASFSSLVRGRAPPANVFLHA